MSPLCDPKREKAKNWNQISFYEDLEHFERNKESIWNQSQIPEVASIPRILNFDVNEPYEEIEDLFVEYKSRYFKERSGSSVIVPEKLIRYDSTVGPPRPSKKWVSKIMTWRIDALRFDDRDSMSCLVTQLRAKRE